LANVTRQALRGKHEIAVTARDFRGASTESFWTGLLGGLGFLRKRFK